MSSVHRHSTHPALLARLKRARGHLSAVIEMIEQSRPCCDVAQQMQAVESAITNAKRSFIHDHIENCMEDGGSEEDRLELKAISRYL